MGTAWNKFIIPKKELENLYIIDKLSISQIAESLGCSTIPIHRMLREYQIPIRSISDAKVKITTNKEELEKLYLEKKLSTDEIGKLLGCNHVTILNKLKAFGITTRSTLGNRWPVQISKEDLGLLYFEQKMSQKGIAKHFGHSPYGIQRWMKIYGIKSRTYSESNTKYPKRDFDGNEVDKAYMIGFRLGDLNVYKVHELVQVRCSTTKDAQIELIKAVYGKYGHCCVWKAKRGTWEIVCLLNKTFNFLLPKKDEIPFWIFNSNKYFLAFFAGYADAEGSWYFKRGLNNRMYGAFVIQSYDKRIITSSARAFGKVCVGCYVHIYLKKLVTWIREGLDTMEIAGG